MRDRYRSAYHEGNIERIHELSAGDAGRRTLLDVVGDTVIATQNDRRGQAHQLFGSFVECAIFVSLRIEREKSFDAEMLTAEQFLVHGGAILIELVHVSGSFQVFRDCTTRGNLSRTARAGAQNH